MITDLRAAVERMLRERLRAAGVPILILPDDEDETNQGFLSDRETLATELRRLRYERRRAPSATCCRTAALLTFAMAAVAFLLSRDTLRQSRKRRSESGRALGLDAEDLGPGARRATDAASTGVKALFREAAGMRRAAETAVATVDSIGDVAKRDYALAERIKTQKDMAEVVAEAAVRGARALEKAAQGSLGKAAKLNNSASRNEAAAARMQHQADASTQRAEKMLRSAEGDHMIKELAHKQMALAKATGKEAISLFASAEGMSNQSERISDKSQRDLAVAETLRKEARTQEELAAALERQATKVAKAAKNATQQVGPIKEVAKSEAEQASKVSGTAKSEMVELVNATSDIRMARLEAQEAQEKIEEAQAVINYSGKLKDKAHETALTASALGHELQTQNRSIQRAINQTERMPVPARGQEMTGMKVLRAAVAVASMARMEQKGLDAEKEIVETQRQRAQQFAKRARVIRTQADQSIVEANDEKDAARKRKNRAAAGRKEGGNIDSDNQVAAAGAGEIQAMKRIADQDHILLKALESDAQLKQTVVEAEKNMAIAELAEVSILLRNRSAASPEGANRLEATAKDIRETTQLAKDIVVQTAASPDTEASTSVASIQERARKALAAAVIQEGKILQATLMRRICVDLPGLRLKVPGERAFSRIVGDDFVASHEECKAKCRRREGCKQAVFSHARGCHLSEQVSTQVVAYTDVYNSSFCGEAKSEAALADLLHKAYGDQTCVRRPQACSWAGEDCSQTRCCNNVECAWDYAECTGYTCYRKDANVAECAKMPSSWWDGAILGGPRTPREIPKVSKPCLMQGTSLFCFSVVTWARPALEKWDDAEAELANNWRQKGLGILQCDDSALFDGADAPTTKFGAISNIDIFLSVWQKVRQDGRYMLHDWVVKVDVDAVFFPDRLKMHLGQLRTSQHAEVYLWNAEEHYSFKGAIEAFTSDALDVYFEHANDCAARQSHDGGEDIYMKLCLDSLGMDHQTDRELLHDKSGNASITCANGWAAAFHAYRSVYEWNACHDAAEAAAKTQV